MKYTLYSLGAIGGGLVLFGVLTYRLHWIDGRPYSRELLIGTPVAAAFLARLVPMPGGRFSATLVTGFGAAVLMALLATRRGEVAGFLRRGLLPDRKVGRDLYLALAFTAVAALTGFRPIQKPPSQAVEVVACGQDRPLPFRAVPRLSTTVPNPEGKASRLAPHRRGWQLYTLCETRFPLLGFMGMTSPFVWDAQAIYFGIVSTSTFGQIVAGVRAVILTTASGSLEPGTCLGMAAVLFPPNLLVSCGIVLCAKRVAKEGRAGAAKKHEKESWQSTEEDPEDSA